MAGILYTCVQRQVLIYPLQRFVNPFNLNNILLLILLTDLSINVGVIIGLKTVPEVWELASVNRG